MVILEDPPIFYCLQLPSANQISEYLEEGLIINNILQHVSLSPYLADKAGTHKTLACQCAQYHLYYCSSLCQGGLIYHKNIFVCVCIFKQYKP